MIRNTFFDTVEARATHVLFGGAHDLHHAGRAARRCRPDTSSLRFGICGAAPASAELLGRFEARYGFPLIEGYGLSEGTCASTINPVDGQRRAGTVGIAFPGQQIRIVDDGGTEVATGVDGEVLIARPQRHARLSAAAPTKPRASSSTAGCTPATSATSTPRAI